MNKKELKDYLRKTKKLCLSAAEAKNSLAGQGAGVSSEAQAELCEHLLEIIDRPPQCFEGGDPKTCECPDHGRTLVGFEHD